MVEWWRIELGWPHHEGTAFLAPLRLSLVTEFVRVYGASRYVTIGAEGAYSTYLAGAILLWTTLTLQA